MKYHMVLQMVNVNMASGHESVITLKKCFNSLHFLDCKQKVKKILINLQQYDNSNKEWKENDF
jgi:hypothetical protein